MICPKCGSNRIKKREDAEDFLSWKSEGEPARKQSNDFDKDKHFCLDCEHKWDSIKKHKAK
ncbi:hypothetical protein KKC65_01575 [Patescibacteria group bacterium]|nr:hypothetical protein [Patescibacteria group bacterium]